MITKSGAKLLDFGLATLRANKSVESSLSSVPVQTNATAKGAIAGTLQYMAPEQLEGKDTDSRTDVFALGAVMYEMLTGRKAFAGVTLFQVEKRSMLRAFHDQADLSGKFMAILLSRNNDLEEDLCDQLFNDSEKRLARVLLKLAHEQSTLPETAMPNLSHETLAEMVGTTRSRVTHFMNKFRKMGLIEYKGQLTGKTEELTDAILHDRDKDKDDKD